MFYQPAMYVLLAFSAANASYLPFRQDATGTSHAKGSGLTLCAELSQVNSTSVNLTIFNDAARDLSLLKWNSLFDTMAEYHSFSVRAPNGIAPPSGRSKIRYIYARMVQNHILTLPAQSSWSGTQDLTDLFDVPKADKYNVSFTSTLTAVSNSTTKGNPYPVIVNSNSQLMNLTTSPSPSSTKRSTFPTKVKRDQIQNLDAGAIWVIRQAVASATAMASVAAQNTHQFNTAPTALYTTYFNDKSEQQVIREASNTSPDAMTNPTAASPGTAASTPNPVPTTRTTLASTATPRPLVIPAAT